MNKGNWGLSRIFIIAVCIILLNGSWQFASEQTPKAMSDARVDLIRIDTMTLFGKLEKPPVEFLHDAHTEALTKKNLDCNTCHLSKDGRFSPKFKRLKDTDKVTVMNLYHKNCIACHGEMRVAGQKTGPVECNDCHREKARFSSARKPIEFDKSLHSQHIEFNGEDCSVCHHDGKKEGSCRYCHKDVDSKEAISLKNASHLSCIGCHRELSGPGKCYECHDVNEQQKMAKAEDVPRLTRGQPDVVLLGADLQADNAVKRVAKMNPVPFDHKAHEASQDTCRVCHHAEISSCTKTCHTITGNKKGAMITTEKAMHQIDNERSCLGCHEINKGQEECAGCHGLMVKNSSNSENACQQCHMEVPKTGEGENPKPESIASMLLESKRTASVTIADSEIPEKVIIKNLSREYGAVDFPHRKIVKTLINNIKDNKLAGYFHGSEGTICQGCHHNSPPSNKPPQCSNCHTATEDVKNPLKPGIKGAYHLQCIKCHDVMKITKVDGCTKCHEENKKPR
jgi:hypothetical protein